MPGVPYSDNMYSGLDDSDADEDLYAALTGDGGSSSAAAAQGPTSGRGPGEVEYIHAQPSDEEALSPSDGYFGQRPASRSGFRLVAEASGTGRSGGASAGPNADPSHPFASSRSPQHITRTSPPSSVLTPQSSQVPHVPDVWVSDPSLEQGSTAESKAREAAQERDQDTSLFAAGHARSRSSAAYPDIAAGERTLDTTNNHPLTSPSSHHRHGAAVAGRPSHSPAGHSLLNNHPSPLIRTAGSAAACSSSTPPSSYHGHAPSASSSARLTSHIGPTRPHSSATIYSERSSLFSEAPPAYTPSPTSPTSTFNGYQTISPPSGSSHTNIYNMSRPSDVEEEHGLLAGQTYQSFPQSMVDEQDEHGHFVYPHTRGWRQRVREFDWRKHWKLIALGALALVVTIALVAGSGGGKTEKTIEAPGGSPVTAPEKGTITPEDDDGTRLAYPVYDNPMSWDPRRVCAPDVIRYNDLTVQVEFSASRNISLFQDVQDNSSPPNNGRDVHISGDVVVRRAGPGTPGPAIVVETIVNDDRIKVNVDWDDAEQRLFLRTPLGVAWEDSRTAPCLQMRATVWVPPGSIIDSLNVEGVHLGVKLLDNVDLRLGSFARLASTVGTIAAAADGEKDKTQLMYNAPPRSFNFDTRYIEVKTMSAAISGSWPLYDYLGLETITGEISARVQPQDVLKETPRPAILYAKSTSGSIQVYEPITEAVAAWVLAQQQQPQAGTARPEALIPPRAYGVDLHSMSGTIKAHVAFSHSCKVHTTSGSVDLALLPVLDRAHAAAAIDQDKPASFLETSSTSGTAAISVMDVLWSDLSTGAYAAAAAAAAAPSLRVLSSRHSTTSATIAAAYPQSFEGYVDADSLTGKISVAGREVEIIRRDEDFTGLKKHVIAHKGPYAKQGTIKLHTTSGSIGVQVGSWPILHEERSDGAQMGSGC